MLSQKEFTNSLKLLFFLTNPLFLVIFLNFFAVILFLILPDSFIRSFTGEGKLLSLRSLILYLIFTLSFCVGYLSVPLYRSSEKESLILSQFKLMYREIKIFAYVTFILTVIGYIIWFKDIYLHFDYYLTLLLTVGAYQVRDILLGKMISGITTFTQFGIISSILCLLLYIFTRKKLYMLFIYVILILAVIRAIFFGERLAILEILIPIMFVYLRFYPEKTKRFFFLLLVGFLIIWSSELFRSYMSPVYHEAYTPFEFLIYRLAMYFVTTVNNGFLIFEKFPVFVNFLPDTLGFLYKILHIHNESQLIYKELLINYLNPEYNNKSAWGTLYFDFGYFGIVITFIIGAVSRILYEKYKRLTMTGVLMYPIFLIFLFQSYRVLYINSSRVIYPYLIILSLILIYNYKKVKFQR